MLVIALRSLKFGSYEPKLIERHVPFDNLPTLANEEIDYVQADGHELEFINDKLRRNTNNVPTHILRAVVRWDGDLAKFIYFNIVR